MPFSTGSPASQRRHVGGGAGWADGGETDQTWITRAEEPIQVEQGGEKKIVKICPNFRSEKNGGNTWEKT